MKDSPTLLRKCVAELVGTFILVFFGVGSVHAAVLTGAQHGIWQVAVVWGAAIMLAIYATGALSGAHMNPAMTLSFAVFRGFSWLQVPFYVLSQLVGAFLGGAVLYSLFSGALGQFESAHGIVRGATGSEASAMIYGEYFPNPAVAASLRWTDSTVTHVQAMLAEGIGTAFLAFFVFAVTDPRNRSGPGRRLLPVFIGLAVAIVISVVAPLTQAGLNPARDFGPRLLAYLAGWGPIAIPGPRGGFFTVYVLSPLFGAVAGAAVYHCLVSHGFAPGEPRCEAAGIHPTVRRTIDMTTTRLLFVGGFLGAGKTTLLWRAAELLAKRGQRVGLITNDQAPDLVDTKWLVEKGLNVREVAGSCFCCNFNGLIDAAEDLRSLDADVLIGEPVGSCTDLSATILQPLKDRFRGEFELAPLSVLADPQRLCEVVSEASEALHLSAAYIFRKQLEEADLLVVNKIDRVSPEERDRLERLIAERFPQAAVRFLSAQTGEGVEAWLDEALSSRRAGSRILEVDYDIYAEGEAVLGWLNSEIRLSATTSGSDWRALCSDLLGALHARFRDRRARIGHVKLLLTAGGDHCVGNLTGLNCEPVVQGRIEGSPRAANLILNARVEMPPEDLERIVREILAKVAAGRVRTEIADLRCLRPGRPQPTHRYGTVVES